MEEKNKHTDDLNFDSKEYDEILEVASLEKSAFSIYHLGALMYDQKKFAIARDIFMIAYWEFVITAQWENAFLAATRLMFYFTKIEYNPKRRQKWVDIAHKIKPNGDAYDILSYIQMAEEEDYKGALASINKAIEIEKTEERIQAKFSVYRALSNELQKKSKKESTEYLEYINSFNDYIHDDFIKDVVKDINTEASEKLPLVIEKNRKLEEKLSVVQKKLKKLYNNTNPQENMVEQNLLVNDEFTELITEERLRSISNSINYFFPEILLSSKKVLLNAYILWEIMKRYPESIDDWFGPIIYISKAIEINLKTQLESFNKSIKNNNLGYLIGFMQENKSSIIDFYSISSDQKFDIFIRELKKFKNYYRNDFTHHDIMEATQLEQAINFVESSNLFPKLNQL